MIEIQEILLDEQVIQAKVRELGRQISEDYAGKDLVLVGVLKGAFMFFTDLARQLMVPVAVDFIAASSYGMSTTTGRGVRIKKDLDLDVTGRHVLLVDTIIDTGQTLDFLFGKLRERGPASLHAAVLLDKRTRRIVEVPLTYRGFEIPDRFVVGYGVDCAELYRNLPYIAAVNV
jgi:hypoxanthine phosphoribosyltransferase